MPLWPSAALSLKCAHHTHYAECMHDWNAIFGHMGGFNPLGCTKGWSGEMEGCRVCYSTESFKATKTSNKEEMAVLLRYGRFLAAILASSKVHFPEFSFISFLCLCPCLCLFEYLWLCLMKGSCPDVRCCTHRTPTKISNLRLSLSCYIYTLRQIAWHCMIQYFMHWHCRSDPEWLMWHWNDWKFVYIAEMQSFW